VNPFLILWVLCAFLGSCGALHTTEPSGPSSPASTATQSPSVPSTQVHVHIGPSGLGDLIVRAVQNAQTSVYVTLYLLTSDETIDALVQKHREGKDVRVLLNRDFPSNNSTSNTDAFRTLAQAGVDVKWAPTYFTYTHQKSFMIDHHTAWITTMNMTPSSFKKNREVLIENTEKDDVQQAEAVFMADFEGRASTTYGGLLVAPQASPNDTAMGRLLALITQAKTDVMLEAETLTDDSIVAALLARSAAGVDVRVLLSSSGDNDAERNAIAVLKQHNIVVKTLATPYLHLKMCIADARTAYAGSANFTTNSLTRNRELGVLTDNTQAVQTLVNIFEGDFTKATQL
jgi:cardiolipin synthase